MDPIYNFRLEKICILGLTCLNRSLPRSNANPIVLSSDTTAKEQKDGLSLIGTFFGYLFWGSFLVAFVFANLLILSLHTSNARIISDWVLHRITRAPFRNPMASEITASLKNLHSIWSDRLRSEGSLRSLKCMADSMLLSNRPLSFRLQVGRVHKYQVGIGVHTQSDIATEIPVFYRITIAKVHDVNSIEVDY